MFNIQNLKSKIGVPLPLPLPVLTRNYVQIFSWGGVVLFMGFRVSTNM
jgi:hypothetical protein